MSTRGLKGLVQRLVLILFKIDQDKALTPAARAGDFGVTHRTSLHDQNERLNFLPIEKADGQYRPHSSALGQVPPQDICQHGGWERLVPGPEQRVFASSV